MELRDYIDAGTKKAGSLTALGKILDVSQPNMSHAKAHKAKLPLDAVTRLADYITTDLKTLLAANELVTEKKEEKRAYWMHFAQGGVAGAEKETASIAGSRLEKLVGRVGIEPTTNGLRVRCSTN